VGGGPGTRPDYLGKPDLNRVNETIKNQSKIFLCQASIKEEPRSSLKIEQNSKGNF